MHRVRRLLTLRKALVVHTVRRNIGKQPHCDAHMNELPVPCTPWDNWYKDKQSYYNKVLILGVLWFFASFAMMIYTDSMYLNFFPPAQPGPPSEMVEECEDVED